MRNKPAKTVLLIESNRRESRAIRRMFNHPGAQAFTFTHVEGMEEARGLVEQEFDVVLLDLTLPADSRGWSRCGESSQSRTRAPWCCSVAKMEALAMQAMREGAQDYLVKGKIEPRNLLRTLQNAIERKTIEEAQFKEKARALAEQMCHRAEHDALTGLPNRLLLSDRLGYAIARAGRNKGLVAVLFLDLDGFKHINDSLGHSAGDKLLQSVSKRLLDCIRTPDTVGRQGGDEFVVLLQDVKQPKDASNAAARILKAVAEPHSIDRREVSITASIGVSIYPNDGRDAGTLINNADTAMYRAKEDGRQSYRSSSQK